MHISSTDSEKKSFFFINFEPFKEFLSKVLKSPFSLGFKLLKLPHFNGSFCV
jgi:hypothetical protein